MNDSSTNPSQEGGKKKKKQRPRVKLIVPRERLKVKRVNGYFEVDVGKRIRAKTLQELRRKLTGKRVSKKPKATPMPTPVLNSTLNSTRGPIISDPNQSARESARIELLRALQDEELIKERARLQYRDAFLTPKYKQIEPDVEEIIDLPDVEEIIDLPNIPELPDIVLEPEMEEMYPGRVNKTAKKRNDIRNRLKDLYEEAQTINKTLPENYRQYRTLLNNISYETGRLTKSPVNRDKIKEFSDDIESIVKNLKKQFGTGYDNLRGLYDSELRDMMKNVKGFVGVYSADTIEEAPIAKNKATSFIMNLDPKNKPGSHWVSIIIDPVKTKSVMYFDPLAQPATNDFRKRVKKVIDSINIPYFLKFKENAIKRQSDTTDTCGYHAMKFIRDISDGISFKDATGYRSNEGEDISGEGERVIEKTFGLI